MEAVFDFEKPIASLERKLQELRELSKQEGVDFSNEIAVLERKVISLIDETFARLTPWQRVQLSRHPSRPYCRDYVDHLFPDFMELQGDRTFGDDQAILAGVATWPPASAILGQNSAPGATETPPTSAQNPSPTPPQTPGLAALKNSVADPVGTERIPILILGHQKGRTTKQKMERNFGMAKPEGYRKAIRLFQMANRFKMPVLAMIDTPGAYPGVEAEERGQAQAIAESIHAMFELKVPTAAVVIGEGGSGGALAIGCADVVLMQEYSTYSVISPESCASILWSDSTLAERASEKLKMSPKELLALGVIDGVVSEPKGAAHRDWPQAFAMLGSKLLEQFGPLVDTHSRGPNQGQESRVQSRIDKFRKLGQFAIAKPAQGQPTA